MIYHSNCVATLLSDRTKVSPSKSGKNRANVIVDTVLELCLDLIGQKIQERSVSYACTKKCGKRAYNREAFQFGRRRKTSGVIALKQVGDILEYGGRGGADPNSPPDQRRLSESSVFMLFTKICRQASDQKISCERNALRVSFSVPVPERSRPKAKRRIREPT